MSIQIAGFAGSNVFKASDAPRYTRGLTICGICAVVAALTMVAWKVLYLITDRRSTIQYQEKTVSNAPWRHTRSLTSVLESDVCPIATPNSSAQRFAGKVRRLMFWLKQYTVHSGSRCEGEIRKSQSLLESYSSCIRMQRIGRSPSGRAIGGKPRGLVFGSKHQKPRG